MTEQRNPGFPGNSRGGNGGAVDLSSKKKLKRGSKNCENSVLKLGVRSGEHDIWIS